MTAIFKLMRFPREGEKTESGVCIGLDLRIGGREVPFPLSKICRSLQELRVSRDEVVKELDGILDEAEGFFSAPSGRTAFSPGTPPREIWARLSKEGDDDFFVSSFNALDDRTRREVAEYVLTQCNVFSGKGAVFAGRYSNESGLLE